MASDSPSPRVAVIGGGITGLAAAHRLRELDPSVHLAVFEAAHRLGGVVETIHRDGFLIEGGADNWITNVPWANDLCRRIGFEEQLVETNPAHRQAFVVRRGRLRRIPPGFVVMAPSRVWPVLATPILSPLGKLRLACEPWVPRRDSEADESLAAFVRRRLGRETYERLVQPLMGGIYTGDPEKLSLRSTMPRFADMEREHGSLVRGLRREASERTRGSDSGARYSMFVAPREGLSSFVEAIAARLPAGAVRTGAPVGGLRRSDAGWTLDIGGDRPSTESYDGVILAASAPAAARLLGGVDPALGDELAAIPHASCSIVCLGYRRSQIAHPLNAFGFVVPLAEQRRILSASFSSVKYPGRAPEDSELIRVFIGGACQADLAHLPDDQLVEIAREELAELLGVEGPPTLVEISRRADAMPQYQLGHPERVERIQQRLADQPGLQLAGNSCGGVGIPVCVRSGEQAAAGVLGALRDRPADRAQRG